MQKDKNVGFMIDEKFNFQDQTPDKSSTPVSVFLGRSKSKMANRVTPVADKIQEKPIKDDVKGTRNVPPLTQSEITTT